MAHIVDDPSWYSRIAELSVLPPEVHYIVRTISWLSISFALALILPVIALVVYDFVLWIWRLLWTPSLSIRPNDVVETDPAIPGTSKSQVTGTELERVHVLDKPASD